MLDLTKLSPDLLGVLRKRLGLEPNSRLRDGIIASYTPEKVAGEWCAWELGDSSWAHAILLVHEQAKNATTHGVTIPSDGSAWHNHTNDLYQPDACPGCKTMAEGTSDQG